ncbi:MAG: carboxylating nicotinate-nucleotide diphosphorylase [Nitrososphaerales archaeon]
MLREALAEFLREDIGKGDITSEILPDGKTKAEIICKERALVAGLKEARILFKLVKCRAKNLAKEGSFVNPNTAILAVEGNAKSILSAERTVLNILMRMSGIATETKRFVDEINKINSNIRIACTRKTAPGFRIFDKRAVKVGGGETHRMRLDEMVLIKDNHLAIIDSIDRAVVRAREIHRFRSRIEVEVGDIAEVLEAVGAGADIIMLDNLTPKKVRSIVNALKKNGLRNKVTIEVSGNVTLKNVKRYASIDIDMISIGVITHSVKAIDMSLEIIKT